MKKLEEELSDYAKSDYYPFHMPGHKRRLWPWNLKNPYEADITEIDGFDNLHCAEGLILEEQRRAADFYGAGETFFSVNGSTACLLSAVSAGVSRGGRLLMARNCHKSVYHAVYLRGLDASYLYPPVDESGICGGIRPEEVARNLREDPEIEAVLITSPTYEGAVSDIQSIGDIVHSYGKLLIVDEAHGAHFGLHPYFPESAVRQGADIVIQSLHKTLPSMTQTALLHRCGERVSSESLHRFLAIYQSSSPSYVLMGSITACLHLLMEQGGDFFRAYAENLKVCRERLRELKNFVLWEIPGADPSKLVLLPDRKRLSMTGEDLYHILSETYHLQLEMAGPNMALAMTSPGDKKEGFERLVKAMEEIDRENL